MCITVVTVPVSGVELSSAGFHSGPSRNYCQTTAGTGIITKTWSLAHLVPWLGKLEQLGPLGHLSSLCGLSLVATSGQLLILHDHSRLQRQVSQQRIRQNGSFF